MQAEITLLRIDLLLETIGAIIAFAISHYANSAYKMTSQKKLSDLSTGFLVLSVSMFGRVIGTIYFFVLAGTGSTGNAESMRNLVIIAVEMLRIMAYILFAVSTRRGIREQTQIGSTSLLLLLAIPSLINPTLEMMAIIVLLVVVLQSLMNYASNRSRFALYVLVGFLFLLLSHIFLIFSFDEYRGYLLSQVFQFLGLIALLVMLIKAGR